MTANPWMSVNTAALHGTVLVKYLRDRATAHRVYGRQYGGCDVQERLARECEDRADTIERTGIDPLERKMP